MSRQDREDKYLESLERKLRELKEENRALNKRLKRVTKGYRKYLDEDVEEAPLKKREEEKVCWECSGNYKLHILLNRRFRQCDNCGKRGKVTVLNEAP